MAFPSEIISKGVAIASRLLKGVKSQVTFQAWVHDDGAGTDTWAAPVTLSCFVDSTKKLIRANAGLVQVIATLTFVDDIANTTPTGDRRRENPVDPRDLFTLADGSTAPIVSIGGFDNPKTGKPFALKVILGNVVRGQ